MPTIHKTGLIWVERALLIAGLLLLGFYIAARIEGVLRSRAALAKFAALTAPAVTTNPSDGAESAQSLQLPPSEIDFSGWDAGRIRAYENSATATSSAPIGILRIPKIHLAAPLFEGTDDLTLNHGVGRIEGTARPGEPGNLGIAGHRDGFFRGLKELKTGDTIDLETLHGTGTYVVSQIRIVDPADFGVLEPGPAPSLTLVTCYPFYFVGSAPNRYIITAFLSPERKSGAESTNAPAAISQTQFHEEEQ